jgi:hypothetical protein
MICHCQQAVGTIFQDRQDCQEAVIKYGLDISKKKIFSGRLFCISKLQISRTNDDSFFEGDGANSPERYNDNKADSRNDETISEDSKYFREMEKGGTSSYSVAST